MAGPDAAPAGAARPPSGSRRPAGWWPWTRPATCWRRSRSRSSSAARPGRSPRSATTACGCCRCWPRSSSWPSPCCPGTRGALRIGQLGAALALAAGAVEKVALDVKLMAQTEVGELSESSAGRARGLVDAAPQAQPGRLGAGDRLRARGARRGVRADRRAGTGARARRRRLAGGVGGALARPGADRRRGRGAARGARRARGAPRPDAGEPGADRRAAADRGGRDRAGRAHRARGRQGGSSREARAAPWRRADRCARS